MQAGAFVMLPNLAAPPNPSAPPLEVAMKRCLDLPQKKKKTSAIREAASFVMEKLCFACPSCKFRSPESTQLIASRPSGSALPSPRSRFPPSPRFWCSRWTETFVCTFAILPVGEFARSQLLLFLEGAAIQTEGAKRALAHYSSLQSEGWGGKGGGELRKRWGWGRTQASTEKSRKFFKETLIK